MNKKYLSVPFELKDVDEKQGIFKGYASVFGNVDSYRDVIDPGAFKKTLSEFAHRVKCLWQHDAYVPIGRPLEMREDDHGLWTVTKLSQTTQGKDSLILLQDQVITEMSIGYSPIKELWDSEAKVRHLTEVKLWEYSLVTWAANDMALITGVKNLDDLGPAVTRLKGLLDELKAGKVLSTQNKQLVEGCLGSLGEASDMLRALLAAAEPDGKSTPGGAEPPPTETDPGVQSVLTLLTEMKRYAQPRGEA